MSPRPHNRKQKRARRSNTVGLAALAAGLAATNPADATVFDESTAPGGDFGNFATATDLPDGTTQVDGTVTFDADADDWFKFNDLKPNTPFTATVMVFGEFYVNFGASGIGFTDAGLNSPNGNTASVMGNVPADGMLAIGLGEIGGDEPGDYQVTLDAWRNDEPNVPEPTTATLGALSIAALAGSTRRRRAETNRKNVKNRR